MNYAPCAMWATPPPDYVERLDAVLDAALTTSAAEVFFRADDVAQPGAKLRAMLDMFLRHHAPLALAAVPAWLPPRAPELRAMLAAGGGLFTLHQHGFRHANHEPQGSRKGEFGAARTRQAKRRDIARGMALLEAHAPGWQPAFTPPWNRCDAETLDVLRELGFRGVSRDAASAAALPAPPGLPDIPVHVDLHIRKEPNPAAALDALLAELAAGLALPRCGVMLHHQRQTPAALAFLGRLLERLAAAPGGARIAPALV